MSGRRRVADLLGITRARDAPPMSWPAAYVSGLCWGIAMGIFFQLTEHRHLSVVPFIIGVSCGLVVYAPVVHWVAGRAWRRAQHRMRGDGT